jgi:hypothetical protein
MSNGMFDLVLGWGGRPEPLSWDWPSEPRQPVKLREEEA